MGIKKASRPIKRKKISGSEDVAAHERGDEPQTIIGHLAEFRSRVLTSLIALLIGTLVPFFILGEKILAFIMKPFHNAVPDTHLQIFALTEGFTLQIKSCLIIGIAFAMPIILYELWSFVRPAISRENRPFLRNTLIAAFFLFYGGVAFTYIVFTPYTIKMLLTFIPKEMGVTINATSYLSFLFFFCIAMGAVFEMPIIIMIATRLGIITPKTLVTKRKYAIVIIWIIAAVITPSVDPLTQSFVAIPLMVLYEVSIVIAKIIAWRTYRAERRNAE
jgi:sec-independent protein translocase protein TatC